MNRVYVAGTHDTKAEELDWVSKNKPAYDDFEFRIRRLDIFDNGTAIVAGTGTIRGKDDKGPYVMEYQSSNVFIKRDGTWRAVASHVSGANDASHPPRRAQHVTPDSRRGYDVTR